MFETSVLRDELYRRCIFVVEELEGAVEREVRLDLGLLFLDHADLLIKEHIAFFDKCIRDIVWSDCHGAFEVAQQLIHQSIGIKAALTTVQVHLRSKIILGKLTAVFSSAIVRLIRLGKFAHDLL